jgi:Skp family chaperone for outer membrane proteins
VAEGKLIKRLVGERSLPHLAAQRMVMDDPLTARSADVRMLLSRKQSFTCKRPLSRPAVVAAAFAFAAMVVFGPSRTLAQQQPLGQFAPQQGAPISQQQAASQFSPQNAATHGVAVVDISYIFKNHARFKAAMEGMKKEMDNIEAQLKAKREEIAKLESKRNSYNLGTPEYKQLDEQLAKEMADFNLDMTRLRKDFLDREAKEYYKTYQEVVDAVGVYATQRNIGLVIRFNADPVDPNRREDVLREINKPVVFQNRIDITGEVLRSLNRDVAVAQPGMQPGMPNGGSMIPRR